MYCISKKMGYWCPSTGTNIYTWLKANERGLHRRGLAYHYTVMWVYCTFTLQLSDISLILLFAVNTKISKNTNFWQSWEKLLRSCTNSFLKFFSTLLYKFSHCALQRMDLKKSDLLQLLQVTTLCINKEGSAARLELPESDMVGISETTTLIAESRFSITNISANTKLKSLRLENLREGSLPNQFT